MTAKKPARKAMLLKLEPETFDLLSEFSRVTGMPKMDFVAGVLADSKDGLRNLIELAREAKAATPPPKILQRLEGVLQDANKTVDQLQLDISLQIDEAKKERRRARKKTS